jgi:sulfur-oxidizing protein SoxY
MISVSRGLDRRTLLQGALTFACTAGAGLGALAQSEERSVFFQLAYRKLVGETDAPEARVKLEIPDIAENGNMVPFTVTIDSPMTEPDHVRAITLFSTGNPQPVVGTFHFTQLSGRASISGRMRLARSQDVVAVAELSNGAFVQGQTNVKVTVGGCGG